jgi:hypothetical protein
MVAVGSRLIAEGTETPFTCATCASLVDSPRLIATAIGAACVSCGRIYPTFDGVACLVPDPERFRFEQLSHLQDYCFVTERRRREIGDERRNPHLLALTRERLLRLLYAMDVERKLLTDVLSTVIQGLDADAARIVPGSAAPSRDLRVLDMYETLFRDWVWGDRESDRGLSLVERLACESVPPGSTGRFEFGRLAVFGAGACRLAADVHRLLGPVATYALDVNPVPLLIAERLLRGAVVEAFEYPIGPRGIVQMAVLQRLCCTFDVPPGLELVLADARRPPFASGELDSVLTPWFIDVVAADIPETAAAIHRVLRPGGFWLNLGPLRFAGSAARRYCIEEVREHVQASGFELVSELTEDVPYFDSPHAGSRRIETVYGFAARRVAPPLSVPAPVSEEPAWVSDVNRPIPKVQGLEALQERLVVGAGALSLIDGRRSTFDIACALGQELGVQPQRLVEPLRSLLVSLIISR